MRYIIDEFDVNLYDYHHLIDPDAPEGTVGISLYGMTKDEQGYYHTDTYASLLHTEVFDPDFLNYWDEDTWIYSHTIRDVDTGPVFDKVKRMHDQLVRQFENERGY